MNEAEIERLLNRRISRERAKELLLEKGGLAARPQSEQAPDAGLAYPSDSSGGTVLVRRK